jgi:hypothetical protein
VVTRAGTPEPTVGPAAGAMLPITSMGGSSCAPLVSALVESGCWAASDEAGTRSRQVITSAHDLIDELSGE